MRKTLILIPCCKTKIPGGVAHYDQSSSILNVLSPSVSEKLVELRRALCDTFGLEPGPDLGYRVKNSRLKYMEAYKRYAGKIYRNISPSSWSKLSRISDLELVIVSALYGLINFDEPIRLYNLTMKDRIPGGPLLKTWWKRHLPKILSDYILIKGFQAIHDFLSIDYSKAVEGYNELLEEADTKVIKHTYPKMGTGSNYRRGEEVNQLIQNF